MPSVTQMLTSARHLIGDRVTASDGEEQLQEAAALPIDRDCWINGRLWLIKLRWMAVLGVSLVVAICLHLGLVYTSVQLYSVIAAMAVYNGLCHLRAVTAQVDGETGRQVEINIALQLLCDLAALTLLVHWSGGLENPFAVFFAFHMAIGAMLVSRRSAYLIAVAALLAYGGTIVAECFGLLEHHGLIGADHGLLHGVSAGEATVLSEPWHDGVIVTGYLSAMALMFFGVIYFVRVIREQRHIAEQRAHERELVARARERMARIGEISSGVAHTIRNPLHGLQNCADLLRSQLDCEEAQTDELLELMSEGLRRIDIVTRRLLSLSREGGSHTCPTDLSVLVDESMTFVSSVASNAGVRIELDLADLEPVPIDPDRMMEVLINLIDNAVFACREGGEVSVRTREVRQPVHAVRIEVQDTGEGIALEEQERIFHAFFTTKPLGDGTGLGLAIAGKIVEDHGGSITVQSVPGQGSTFVIEIPVEREQEAVAVGAH